MAEGAAGGWMAAAGTFAQIWGNLDARKAAKREAEAQAVAYEFEAKQADAAGVQVVAASQRTALEERRRADLVASRALAVAAASGGGTTDPTIVRIISNVKGEGAYRASVALYEGEQQERDLKIAAAMSRLHGASGLERGVNLANAYSIRAAGTAFSGGASIYSKYGQGGPKGTKGSGDAAIINYGDNPEY